MKTLIVFVTACVLLKYANGAILFPEELPTISGIIYSLLPPVRIGQDTRFGVGFRLGRNADAQVLIELGPQENTRTLGGGSGKRQSSSRRETLTSEEREKIRGELMDKLRGMLMDRIGSSTTLVPLAPNATDADA